MFGIWLVPQILDVYHKKTTMNLVTCGITLIWLAIFGVTYATLNFWFAVFGDMINVTAWGLLLVLSIRR
jgi:hypothetical protein